MQRLSPQQVAFKAHLTVDEEQSLKSSYVLLDPGSMKHGQHSFVYVLLYSDSAASHCLPPNLQSDGKINIHFNFCLSGVGRSLNLIKTTSKGKHFVTITYKHIPTNPNLLI